MLRHIETDGKLETDHVFPFAIMTHEVKAFGFDQRIDPRRGQAARGVFQQYADGEFFGRGNVWIPKCIAQPDLGLTGQRVLSPHHQMDRLIYGMDHLEIHHRQWLKN